ncbi:hypothetical protein HKD37_01G001428 [Glycine soja]
MQSYPARALDRKLQVDWARYAREGPRVLMSLRSTKFRALLSLFRYSSPSSSKHLSMASYGVASPLSLPSPFRCHLSSKKQRNPLMKKILGLQAPMELASCGIRASSSSVNGEGSTPKDPLYKILDELRSLKLWKEKQERKEKGKKRVEEISQDERKKIREEERRKIMKEMKREKHVSYSSHNSCKSLSEELRDYYEGRHSEEIYPQEEGQPLMVKEECKEVSVSSKRLAKKERHFEIKTNIKEISLLRQHPHFLLCKKTLVSIATSLRLEFIPQVKELLDEGLVRKRLNPCALLVPKISIIRHQIPKIGGVMNALGGQILFKGEGMMQSYPARALDRKLQVDWARYAREGPRVLMSLRTHLLLEVASPLSLPSPFRCHLSSKKQRNPLMKNILGLQAPMELASNALNGPLCFLSVNMDRSKA